MLLRKVGVIGTMLFTMTAQGAESNPLLGCWQCEGGDESHMVLRFNTNHYVIDGEPLEYRLVPGAIQVPEPDGYSRYPYRLDNGRLTIEVQDTQPLVCIRTTCPAGAQAK